MRWRRSSCLIMIGLCLAIASVQAASLRLGSKGPEVWALQENLSRLGFFGSAPTGYYGQATFKAVKSFQQVFNLTPDGVAGEKTLTAIAQAVSRQADTSSRDPGVVAAVSWDTVNRIWKIGTTARVYDVDTGVSLTVWREFGHYHADVEPYTKYDTYQLLRIYGGKWSWERHAVIVELNGRFIAGSMNGMPHGQEEIHNNDFDGQFCIHFLGSRLHKNGRVDPVHQAMVAKAARIGINGIARPAMEPTVTAEQQPAAVDAAGPAEPGSPGQGARDE